MCCFFPLLYKAIDTLSGIFTLSWNYIEIKNIRRTVQTRLMFGAREFKVCKDKTVLNWFENWFSFLFFFSFPHLQKWVSIKNLGILFQAWKSCSRSLEHSFYLAERKQWVVIFIRIFFFCFFPRRVAKLYSSNCRELTKDPVLPVSGMSR